MAITRLQRDVALSVKNEEDNNNYKKIAIRKSKLKFWRHINELSFDEFNTQATLNAREAKTNSK